MFSLSQPAKDQLDAYFEGKDKSSIRIFLSSGGCSGPRLALALDDPTDADNTFQEGGYQFVVDKELMDQAQPITVDISPMGFDIRSSLELGGGGCSSCGGSCSE
jgi:Fe-S cluster assembly iron-binding protein IscA